MKAYDWEAMMIDEINGELGAHEHKLLNAELEKHPALMTQFVEFQMLMGDVSDWGVEKPSSRADLEFKSMLRDAIAEQQVKRPARQFRISLLQGVAAMGLILLGLSIGLWLKPGEGEELAEMRKELQETKSMMFAYMENAKTSTRIKGVNVAYNVDQPDREMLNALVQILNEDKSSNVRLAAIEALGQYMEFDVVKKAMVSSLARQTEPVVQIALIQNLIQNRETRAVPEFEEMLTKEEVDDRVKDELRLGISKIL